MYFNATVSSTTKLLKPLLVFAFCMAAGLAGLTQITQYRSHPIDVYVGYLIGAGIGVYLVSKPSAPLCKCIHSNGIWLIFARLCVFTDTFCPHGLVRVYLNCFSCLD